MRNQLLSTIILGAAISLTACTNDKDEPKDLKLSLSQTDFEVVLWQQDGSHITEVSGSLTAGDEPVSGAVVQLADKRLIETNEDGKFNVHVDLSTMENEKLHVVSLDNAKIGGKKLNKQLQKQGMDVEQSMYIHYPIVIDEVTANVKNASLVDVKGHAKLGEDQKYPGFGPDSYLVSGTVKDADGNALQTATINLRRDGVEGFSISSPSDTQGKYSLFYLPDEEEDHYFYVHYNGVKYTLPPNKVYHFPEDVSVNIDILLPKEGTIIDDKPPTLVTQTAPGGHYKGVLIGVNVADGVKYDITIPNRDGTFTLTLPKSEWDKNPSFFETHFSEFMDAPKAPGEWIPSTFIPAVKDNEPSEIKLILE